MTSPDTALPDDIAAAIDDLVIAVDTHGAVCVDDVINSRATLITSILARITSAEAERDGAWAIVGSRARENQHLEARLTAAEAAQDEAENRVTHLVNEVQDYAMRAIKAEAARDEARARAGRLEKAIRDFLTGDYPNPRNHRPGRCEHGTSYWEECAQCDITYFEAALAHPAPAEET